MRVLFHPLLIPIWEGSERVRIHHALVVDQLVFFLLGCGGQLVFLGIPHDFLWYGHGSDARLPDSSGEVKSSSTSFLRISKLTYLFPRLLSVMPRT